MAHLFNRLRVPGLAKVPVRHKNGPLHWATLRKKKFASDKALEHFDDFYASVYGNSWQHIRTALLQDEHKYMAVVNNYSDTERIQADLQSQGAINLRAIYESFKQRNDEEKLKKRQSKKKKETEKRDILDEQMNTILSNAVSTDAESIYSSEDRPTFDSLTLKAEKEKQEEEECIKKPKKETAMLHSIEDNPNEIERDSNRIIASSKDTSSLYEYMPVSRLKGMEDWVLESEYYDHYVKGSDFSIDVKKETQLSFPEHLHAYTFESENESRFRAPKKGSTNLLDYYLFDGGSILPVLALDLQPGDNVLDMCAAPGGKALTILQTFTPNLMVANDVSQSRVNRIERVFEQYIGGIGWKDKLFLTHQDARNIEDADVYNKILVDVPCTTDRHVLHNDDNNLFKPSRVKERLQLPELQTEILFTALKIIKQGGTVVYSTCSLSPVQNAGVVQMALKKIWEETDYTIVVKDMSMALKPLQCLFKFNTRNVKYGHIAIPTLGNNWGPMYFCKIMRVE